MSRRSRAGGKPAKAQRRKTITPQRRNASKAVRPRNSTGRETEVARLTHELNEARQQQTATADILRVIARTPEDSKRALDAIAETAVRTFDADAVNFRRIEGNVLRIVGAAGPIVPRLREAMPDLPLEPTDLAVRSILDNRQISIADRRVALANERGEMARLLRNLPVRSQAFTPLSRQGEAIGVMIVARSEVRPFKQAELDLMTGFADQAVIAIENARLLKELRESLEQKTATSEVLSVISSSPDNIQPVLEIIGERAEKVCDAEVSVTSIVDGDLIRLASVHGVTEAGVEAVRHAFPMRLTDETVTARAIRTRSICHVADVLSDPLFQPREAAREAARISGYRGCLGVPMVRDEQVVGAIFVARKQPGLFSDARVQLLKTFADQAVIAIENTRLLNELNKLNQQLEQRVVDQVSEIERMSRLRRFLPPQVADLIVASGTEKRLESHRREITALFCDLRGFTGFSEKSDPEDVMSLLREYHAAIGEIIIKYSGTLEHYAGDGVMVFFNDPIPVPNPALQAVRTALDMRMAIESLTEKWRRLGHELGFGVGIAHGFATLGTIGFEGRFDYAAIGTVSNIASRLCDEAKSGQILISPRVLMAVEDAVSVEPVGDFMLKGISRPVAAYNVLSAVSAKI
jgi:class 3 adenylate cyclase